MRTIAIAVLAAVAFFGVLAAPATAAGPNGSVPLPLSADSLITEGVNIEGPLFNHLVGK
ncbi:hypothetical protein [Streptomyces sp. URMC 123]|uniref:hypothetical protein n=1 Tax=Streptomyces sp. URMC 123 TaxID=3423403 RepID=UPI003F1B06F5